jgi:DNA-binding MarR family transcriptional regulator
MLGVTSLSHAANVVPTTGLRWQKVLFEEGLIERGPHVRDSRQQLVRLTDKGRRMMEKYLIRLFYCTGSETADTD